MNTKPRYHTEEQILKLIESRTEKARVLEQEGWECERRAVACLEESAKFGTMNDREQRQYLKEKNFHYSNPDAYLGSLLNEVKNERVQSQKVLKRAKSLMEKKLPQLKAKLAEFRTPQIPQMDNGDRSVPVA